MTILILGIGNPILTDDGVGIVVARRVHLQLQKDPDVAVEEACMGGMAMVEMMMGYDTTIVVDAVLTGKDPVGTIRRMTPSDFSETVHASTPHDMGFLQAIEVIQRTFPDELPGSIVIYSIEVDNITDFSEALTPDVERAVPKAVEMVLNEVRSIRDL